MTGVESTLGKEEGQLAGNRSVAGDRMFERIMLDGIRDSATEAEAGDVDMDTPLSGQQEGSSSTIREDVAIGAPATGPNDLGTIAFTSGLGQTGTLEIGERPTVSEPISEEIYGFTHHFHGASGTSMAFDATYPLADSPDHLLATQANHPPTRNTEAATLDNPSAGDMPWTFPTLGSADVLVNPSPAILPRLTRPTQWMPDFTFGPASELIDIKKFLEDVQTSFGQTGLNVESAEVEDNKWIHPEMVAGWSDLQALGAEDRLALDKACSVIDLLGPVADIASDPAQLGLVKDMHSRSTLATLGHTTDSIKLPPEKRDRKRKRGGKVDGMGVRRNNQAQGIAEQHSGDKSAQEWIGHGPHGQGSENGGQPAVSPSMPVSEPVLGCTPAGDVHLVGGTNRKGKERAETEETASNSGPLELGDILGSLKLRSWLQSASAKHHIRKPRSSDVNVLTRVRPSVIPFILPEAPTSQPGSSPDIRDLQGSTRHGSPHALVELSILTPAPHPPHTPRHTMSLALLNSQTLEDISEALVCPNRWIPRSINDNAVPSGGCIVVEGTVYGDGEGDADGKDYADKVTEYVGALKAQANVPTGLGKKERAAIMTLDEKLTIGLPMLSTRLDSIQWKLHKPYWLMHDGGCVHWIVVSSISLLNPHDPPLPTPEKPSNWPYVTSLSPLPHRALCRVCSRVPAVLAISGDSRLGESPSLVCNGCWALLGEPKVGRDYPEGARLIVLPLVSPDGL